MPVMLVQNWRALWHDSVGTLEEVQMHAVRLALIGRSAGWQGLRSL